MTGRQQDESFGNARVGVGIALFGARCLALCLEVFIRRQFGRNHLRGVFALGAWAAPMLFTAWYGYDPGLPAMLWFWVAWMAAYAARQAGVLQRRGTREDPHSDYNGWPELMRWFPAWDEVAVKRKLEPLACLAAAGVLYLVVSRPLGGFVALCAVCLLVTHAVWEAQEYEQVKQLQDALMHQKYLAGRARGLM